VDDPRAVLREERQRRLSSPGYPLTDRDLIDAARAPTKLTQRDFARLVVGVDPQTVSNWRRGVRTMEEPTRRLLRLLAAHPRLARELADGG